MSQESLTPNTCPLIKGIKNKKWKRLSQRGIAVGSYSSIFG